MTVFILVCVHWLHSEAYSSYELLMERLNKLVVLNKRPGYIMDDFEITETKIDAFFNERN